MALLHCNFYSEVLGMSTSMYVILPQTVEINQTLYLLHGLSEDYSVWMRRSSIERYVDGKNLAVVMPEVHRGFYTDMENGGRYWTFISEELPKIARSMFRLSDKREDNFAAGLSMGGYGAFKLALGKPECFAAAASLSGGLDMAYRVKIDDENKREWENVFGALNKVGGSVNDLLYLAENLKKSGQRVPKLYQWCGTEDFLYQDNMNFLTHAKDIGLDVTYEEGQGDHQWLYWDQKIKRALEVMGI